MYPPNMGIMLIDGTAPERPTLHCWCMYTNMRTSKINIKHSHDHFILYHFNPYKDKTVCWPLTHWCRVTHICAGDLTNTGLDKSLLPGRYWAIIWTIAGIRLNGQWRTQFQPNFNQNSYAFIQENEFKKFFFKMAICSALNVFSNGIW